MPGETVRLDGHIIDLLTLSKVLDLILRDGGQYRITGFKVGATRSDISHAEIAVTAADLKRSNRSCTRFSSTARRVPAATYSAVAAQADGVFPRGLLRDHQSGDRCPRLRRVAARGAYRDGLRHRGPAGRGWTVGGVPADAPYLEGRRRCRRRPRRAGDSPSTGASRTKCSGSWAAKYRLSDPRSLLSRR